MILSSLIFNATVAHGHSICFAIFYTRIHEAGEDFSPASFKCGSSIVPKDAALNRGIRRSAFYTTGNRISQYTVHDLH